MLWPGLAGGRVVVAQPLAPRNGGAVAGGQCWPKSYLGAASAGSGRAAGLVDVNRRHLYSLLYRIFVKKENFEQSSDGDGAAINVPKGVKVPEVSEDPTNLCPDSFASIGSTPEEP